jgi:uncharacterized protein
MDTHAISSTTTLVLWASFLVSVLFGAIVQRTHFCTMGAVSDIFHMGDWTRMRMWVLAIGVAILGFEALVLFGVIDPSKTLYASSRVMWLSALVGGTMFGFGMVLGSGCGSKTLVRMGGGNLKSVVVFVMLGLAAFATLKGITAVARVATVDRFALELGGNATMPLLLAKALGMPLATAAALLSLILGSALIAWALAGRGFIRADNLLAGIGIGAAITAMWWISGHVGYVAEHPETLQEAFLATNSGRAEALSFVAPVAYSLDWLLFFSDKSKVLTVGIVSVVGVTAGSALAALVAGTFRWEGFRDASDTGHHLVGGALMGVGGVTALGCTVGQGLSGISTLSLTSVIALAAILAGGVAGLRYQVWQLERSSR